MRLGEGLPKANLGRKFAYEGEAQRAGFQIQSKSLGLTFLLDKSFTVGLDRTSEQSTVVGSAPGREPNSRARVTDSAASFSAAG